MKKIAFVFLTIGLLASNNLMAETVLYCQSELATGAIKENGSWRTAAFTLERYTIKFNKDYSKLYGLDTSRSFSCSPAYSHKPDSLACLSGYSNGESFIFNKKTKRFTFSQPAAASGYDSDDSTSTPFMSFGTCQKF